MNFKENKYQQKSGKVPNPFAMPQRSMNMFWTFHEFVFNQGTLLPP
jgi:hypothetical protein